MIFQQVCTFPQVNNTVFLHLFHYIYTIHPYTTNVMCATMTLKDMLKNKDMSTSRAVVHNLPMQMAEMLNVLQSNGWCCCCPCVVPWELK